MTVPPEVSYPVLVAGLGAGVAWIRSVEARLSTAQAVIEKMDELVQLLLEDRLAQRNEKATPRRS